MAEAEPLRLEYPHQFRHTGHVLLLLMGMSALLQLPVPLSCARPPNYSRDGSQQKCEIFQTHTTNPVHKYSAAYINMYHVYLILCALVMYFPVCIWKSREFNKISFTVKMAEVAEEMDDGNCRKSLICDIADRVKYEHPNLQHQFSVLQLSKIFFASLPLLISVGVLDVSTCLFYPASEEDECECFWWVMTPALLVWLGYLTLKETCVLFCANRMISPEYREKYYQNLLSSSGERCELTAKKRIEEVLKGNGFLVLQDLPERVRRDVIVVLSKQD